MAMVYFDNPYNSTFFTSCCNVAICDDQKLCPQCHSKVEPEGRRERFNYAHSHAKSKGYGNWFPNHGKL